MIIDHQDFRASIKPNVLQPPFKYLFPIPAGRNDEAHLNNVSDLLIQDGHDLMVNGFSNDIIFMGSHWESLLLAHRFDVSGADLRKRRFQELNQAYLSTKTDGRRINDSEMITIPRGLETINKFTPYENY